MWINTQWSERVFAYPGIDRARNTVGENGGRVLGNHFSREHLDLLLRMTGYEGGHRTAQYTNLIKWA